MNYQFSNQQPNMRRSGRMEFYALTLGIIALVGFCFVYPPLICGSLAIVFALLSRGGESTFAPKARAGLILGILALSLIVLVCVGTITYILVCYGSFDNMLIQMEDVLRPMYESMGINFDALLQYYQ